MIILHGVYDNGKIHITEKNPPQVKAEIEIQIPETGLLAARMERFRNIAAKMGELGLVLPAGKDLNDWIDGGYDDLP